MPQKTTPKAMVMGFPISHSLSPALHGYWLKKTGAAGQYDRREVHAGQLRDALMQLIDEGYCGGNLTVPLKEEALELMDHHDDSALISGAVNTVVVKNGKLWGYESDGFGFLENLRAQAPDWCGKKVVVIGTGGAARSIISALKTYGRDKTPSHFVLVNRTRERAEKLVQEFDLDAEIHDWDARHMALSDATLLINGTSLGMVGQPELTLDLQRLPPAAVVCDMVYRPLQTPLLAAAAARGHVTVDGLGMLIHQGRLGFQKWFGVDPPVVPDLIQHMRKLAA